MAPDAMYCERDTHIEIADTDAISTADRQIPYQVADEHQQIAYINRPAS